MAQSISLTGKVRPFFSAAVYGFRTVFAMISYLRTKKRVGRYFVIPFMLNVLLFAGMLFITVQFFHPWIMSFLPVKDVWYIHAVRAVASVLFAGITVIVMLMAYSVIGAIISAPFNDVLSERVERAFGAVLPERRGISNIVIEGVRAISSSLKLFVFVVLLQLLILLLNIIPVVGTIVYSIFSFWLWCFFLGFQSVDYSLERRRFSFRQKLHIAGRFKWLYFGIGCAMFVITFIPAVGFMAMTLGAASGARLWVEEVAPACSLTVLTTGHFE